MIVDAHHHLWTADCPLLADETYAPIRRDYTVDDLRDNLSAAGVDACVLVEPGRRDVAETVRCLATAAETPEIVGVVGWVPLTDPAVADLIGKYRTERGGQLLVGARDQVIEEADDFLDRRGVQAGLRAVADCGLVNELVVRVEQLPSVARAATALPDARFVLHQLGSPWIAGGIDGLAEWLDAIRPVAACPNVVAKLSGLVTLAHWDRWRLDDLRPYADHAVGLFGTGRLMFGSDWPVCELAASYQQVTQALVSLLGGHPVDVFAETAISTYQLEIDVYHRPR